MASSSKLKYVAYGVFILLCILCIAPFILLIIASFTDNNTLVKDGYSFFPRMFSLDAYRYLFFQKKAIGHSYLLSIEVTVIGTAAGLLISMLLAYPLSRTDLAGRKWISFFIYFTMLFSGGMVPSYLLYVRYLGMRNTVAGLIIPHLLVNAFNVILLRTYFKENVPPSLIESARIDGAGEWRILGTIVMPISTPILATVGLLIGVAYWNDWYNGMMYATKAEYYSIQALLNKMLNDLQFLASNGVSSTSQAAAMTSAMPTATVRIAIATLVVVPILLVFPFFQKYFSRGITVGAVKG